MPQTPRTPAHPHSELPHLCSPPFLAQQQHPCHIHPLQDNWPELRTILSDLSPFYLEKARASIREWKQARQPRSRLGGVDDAGVEYLQTAAEDLSMPDESVDVVSVFLGSCE